MKKLARDEISPEIDPKKQEIIDQAMKELQKQERLVNRMGLSKSRTQGAMNILSQKMVQKKAEIMKNDDI